MSGDTELTATEVLRGRVRVLALKAHLGPLARDAGCGVEALDSFWRDQGALSNEVLGKLAKHFFDADFDANSNRMIAKPKPPATPLYVGSRAFDPVHSLNFDPSTANYRGGRGCAAAPITKPGTWPMRRPGFAGD